MFRSTHLLKWAVMELDGENRKSQGWCCLKLIHFKQIIITDNRVFMRYDSRISRKTELQCSMEKMSFYDQLEPSMETLWRRLELQWNIMKTVSVQKHRIIEQKSHCINGWSSDTFPRQKYPRFKQDSGIWCSFTFD